MRWHAGGEAAVEMRTCSVFVVLPGEVCACAAMAIVGLLVWSASPPRFGMVCEKNLTGAKSFGLKSLTGCT